MTILNFLGKRPHVVLIILFACISIKSFESDFLAIDDSMLIVHNPLMSLSWSNVRSIFIWPMNQFYDASYYPHQMQFVYYRPILLCYYLLNVLVWGINPVGFHISNLLLHLLTTFLIFRTALLLFAGNRGLSLLAAAFFCVHPVHNELIGRVAMNENLLGLTMIASFYFYLQGRRSFSLISFAFALLTKESAVMLPFVLLIFELNNKRLKDAAVSLIPYAALMLPYLVVRATIVYTPNIQLLYGDVINFMLRSSSALAAYLKLLLVPIDLGIFYPSWSYDTQPPGNLLLTGFILMTVFCALWLWRTEPTMRGLLLGTVTLLIPVLFNANNIILGFDKAFIAERQLYVPSILFSLFIASVIYHEDDLPAKFMATTMLFVIPFFAYKLGTFSTVWKNDQSVFTEFVRNYPDTFLARKTKASQLHGQGDHVGAMAAYQALMKPTGSSGSENSSGSPPIVRYMNKQHHLGAALAPYQVWFADIHFSIGLLHMARNDLDAATQKFKVALLLEPYFYGARVSLARAYLKQGRYSDAAREYAFAKKEITLIPGDNI